MFCPICEAEYLPGITHCTDCDVDLVANLEEETDRDPAQQLSDENLTQVWIGGDQRKCVSICEHLRDAEIPFKVIERNAELVRPVDEIYEIGVPPKFSAPAEEIIGRIHLDFSDVKIDPAVMELPAEDGLADPVKPDKGWDPDTWDSDRATVEIPFPSEPLHTEMIEASLRENGIYYRADAVDDGSRKIFVMPEDEVGAREIVREIEEGAPPK